MTMKKLLSIVFFLLISFTGIKSLNAQVEKANHVIVLIDDSGWMDSPTHGGFNLTQLNDLIKDKLPKVLFDEENPAEPGKKLLGKNDYLTVYFVGVNRGTGPEPEDLVRPVLGYEFTKGVKKWDFQAKVKRLNLNDYFNKDFAGMTLAKLLALYRLGKVSNKPSNIGNTYFIIITDGQLNSNDITTELTTSPFTNSYGKRKVSIVSAKVTQEYSIPTTKSKFLYSYTLKKNEDDYNAGLSFWKVEPRAYNCNFNVSSILMDLNSDIELKRKKDWYYEGKYHATLNPAKTNKYEILNINWAFYDIKKQKILKSGHIRDVSNGINIDLQMDDPVKGHNNYQLQLTYDILLKDVYGCTVISPKTQAFDATDNLSMAVGVYPEKNAEIFGFWDLPSALFFTFIGDQQSNVVFWNVIFSLIGILIIIMIIRQIYIYEFTKKTDNVKTTIV